MSEKNLFRSLRGFGKKGLYRRFDEQRQTLLRQFADLHAPRVWALPDKSPLREAEFKSFSQYGEDGIIQYLVSRIEFPDPSFVEFGVEDYCEANTRLLLIKQNWRGLIMDGNPKLEEIVRRQSIYLEHSLTCRSAFITADNINELLTDAGFSGDIGLLSIDIDGNDYWVWKAIDAITPRIVVCEYNSVLGCERAVTTPYDPAHTRFGAHPSGLYFGASLPALCRLAQEKGYAFVGCTTAGNDAFFVRNDVAAPFRALSAKQGYVLSHFRDARDEQGKPNYLDGLDRLRAIKNMSVADIDSGELIRLEKLLP